MHWLSAWLAWRRLCLAKVSGANFTANYRLIQFISLIMVLYGILNILIRCYFVALSWYFIFSKPAYQELKSLIEKNIKLIEKWKRGGKDDKKRLQMEADLKLDNAKLAGMKAYNMMFLSVIMLCVYQGLKAYYAETVVAKLPFVPFALFSKIFQAGLITDDPSACSMAGIYALCSIGLRASVVKAFGETNPKGSGAGGLMEQLQQAGAITK
jgi:uncharacterized membrane protein (DUF106 family)